MLVLEAKWAPGPNTHRWSAHRGVSFVSIIQMERQADLLCCIFCHCGGIKAAPFRSKTQFDSPILFNYDQNLFYAVGKHYKTSVHLDISCAVTAALIYYRPRMKMIAGGRRGLMQFIHSIASNAPWGGRLSSAVFLEQRVTHDKGLSWEMHSNGKRGEWTCTFKWRVPAIFDCKGSQMCSRWNCT